MTDDQNPSSEPEDGRLAVLREHGSGGFKGTYAGAAVPGNPHGNKNLGKNLGKRSARRRPLPIPDEYLVPADSVEPAMWLGARIRHFRRLVMHPLYYQIHGRMIANQSPYRIATWLQWKVGPDDPFHGNNLSYDALVRTLYRYKRLLPEAIFLPQTYLDDILRKADVDIGVIEELGTLITYQKQRVSQFAGKEKDFPLGMTVEQQRKEVVTLADLLVKMRDTQIALGAVEGILPNSVSMMQLNITQNIEERPQDALSRHLEANPGDIPRVMAALDALRGVYEGHAEELPEEVGDDGD